MDIEPPAKRRRTSQSGSDDSSRSRIRSRSRSRSRSASQEPTKDGDQNQAVTTANDQDSSDRHRSKSPYYTPQTGSPRPSYGRSHGSSSSQSPNPSELSHPALPTTITTTTTKSRLTFTPLFSLPAAHLRGITSAAFSPDSTLLATASADSSIKIYSVPHSPTASTPFPLLRTLHGHKAGINALSWSPIGPPYTLASASDDKSILLWTPLSSDFPIPPSPLTGHSNYVYSLAFSPKGNMLVTGSYDEAVFLWDVRSARVMRQLPAHSDPVSGVDFVHDGTMVCSCASDGLIRIWDAGTGQCLKTLVHEDRKAVTAVRFTPNGRFVLAWTLDGCIRLWRYLGADGGGCVKTYQGHVNERYSLAGTVGEYFVIEEDEDDHEEQQVPGEKGQDKAKEKEKEKKTRSRTEAFVASGSEDGDVVVWDINSKDVLWRGTGHSDVVLSVNWARAGDGRGMLVSVGKDRVLKVWIEDVKPRSAVSGLNSEAEKDADLRGHMVQLDIKKEDTDMDG